MKARLKKIGQVLAQVLATVFSILFLIVVFSLVITNQLRAEPPFEGNLLPDWDCETLPAITSGSWPGTVLIVYRTKDGASIYIQFYQSGLKNRKLFYSEHCPKGVLAVDKQNK